MTSVHDGRQGTEVQALGPLPTLQDRLQPGTHCDPGHLPLVILPADVISPPPGRSVQTFADKSKQEALKNDLVEALKRKQQC